MTEKAIVICMIRTPEDTDPDVAGKVCGAEVPSGIAAQLARSIDERGDAGAGEYLAAFDLGEGESIAAGHGVHVEYASGVLRGYRAQ